MYLQRNENGIAIQNWWLQWTYWMTFALHKKYSKCIYKEMKMELQFKIDDFNEHIEWRLLCTKSIPLQYDL